PSSCSARNRSTGTRHRPGVARSPPPRARPPRAVWPPPRLPARGRSPPRRLPADAGRSYRASYAGDVAPASRNRRTRGSALTASRHWGVTSTPTMAHASAAEFEAAGLYDPAAPNAADRLALLEWLQGLGATISRMVDAQRRGGLYLLAGELALGAGRHLRLAEVAERAGVSAERIEQIRLSVGLPPVDPSEPRFSDGDAESFASFDEPVRFFGEQAVRRFLRVIGSSFSRIAEAAVSLFEVNVETPFREASATELELAQANLQAITMLRGTHR